MRGIVQNSILRSANNKSTKLNPLNTPPVTTPQPPGAKRYSRRRHPPEPQLPINLPSLPPSTSIPQMHPSPNPHPSHPAPPSHCGNKHCRPPSRWDAALSRSYYGLLQSTATPHQLFGRRTGPHAPYHFRESAAARYADVMMAEPAGGVNRSLLPHENNG